MNKPWEGETVTSSFCRDERLCTIQIDVPSQVREGSKTLPLVVGLWVNKVADSLEVDGVERLVEFGFHSVRLDLNTINCDIPTPERLQIPFSTIKRQGSTQTDNKAKLDGRAGAKFGLPGAGFVASKVEGAASVQGQSTELVNFETTTDQYLVRSVGSRSWEFAGHDDRAQGVLQGKRAGDEQLCHIQPTSGDVAPILVTGHVVAHKSKLWIKVDPRWEPPWSDREARNKEAVLKLIASRGGVTPSEPNLFPGEMLLASDTMTLRSDDAE